MTAIFDSAANWIWSPAAREFNAFVCFRRTFEVRGKCAAARILITADARYELYLNGQWLGHGPVRSFVEPWPVDEYDLSGLLRDGANVLAVLVQHYGISNFQYIHAQEGLLAQAHWTDAAGENTLATDASWRATPHEGYAWPVPRIACQQAWEEQFDARKAPGLIGDWTAPAFDDSAWPAAKVVRPAGAAPHATFEMRDIPMLTREPVEPAAMLAVETIRPANYFWALPFRFFLNAADRSANIVNGRLIAVTHVHSPRKQKIQLQAVPASWGGCAWKLNGKAITFDDRGLSHSECLIAHAVLSKGWNTLMLVLPDATHDLSATLIVWTREPVEFSARGMGVPPMRGTGVSPVSGPPEQQQGNDKDRAETALEHPPRRATHGQDARATAWLVLGPFEKPAAKENCMGRKMTEADHFPAGATEERYKEICERGTLTPEDLAAAHTREMPPDCVGQDAYATCLSERAVAGDAPRVDEPGAMLHDTADWTTIHPNPNGDVRLLLDFGREVVGYHEIEIDAPSGAVIDTHSFEHIHRDGRYNLAEYMRCTFRYTCREGVQRYRTFVRRGFRYTWVSFRNFTRPIRVRFVRLLMSTYPVHRAGDFACSDQMLTQAWHVGAHSVRCCSEDTYTDCPSREQTFWVGDARNEAVVDLVANGDPRLSWRCWQLAGRTLDRGNLVECIAPSDWIEVLPAWTFLWMRWAQEHYMLTGDDGGGRMMEFLDRNAQGIASYVNQQGLLHIVGWNMFDWAPMETPRDGIVTHLNCLAVLGLRQTADLARRLGRKDKAKEWELLATGIAKAVNKHLWDDRKKAYFDCIRADGTRSQVFSQQTATAAYISGVATGARGVRCRQIVEKPPKGFVPAGSPFFMFFALEGMIREGQHKKMVDTIREFWGAQIQLGATTFWETYNPADKGRMTYSHCHGWSAAPTYFLSQQVLGITPAEAGYAVVRVAPHPAGLTWAHGRVPTPRGNICIYWKDNKDAFEMDLTLPPNTPAVIELPVKGKLTVLEGKIAKSGRKITCKGGRLQLSVRK